MWSVSRMSGCLRVADTLAFDAGRSLAVPAIITSTWKSPTVDVFAFCVDFVGTGVYWC